MRKVKETLPRMAALLLTFSLALTGCQGTPDDSEAQNSQPEDSQEQNEQAQSGELDESGGLIDFTSPFSQYEGYVEIDQASYSVTLGSTGGDHGAVYNGLEVPTNSFVLEADVELLDSDDENQKSAALIFGVEDKEYPTAKWYGANIDTSLKDETRLFRVFGAGIDTNTGGEMGDIDITAPLHLKLDVQDNGNFTYSFGNVGDAELRSITGTIPNWVGGYVGILSFRSKAKFSNISFENRSTGVAATVIEINDEGQDNPAITGIIDFTSLIPNLLTVNESTQTVTVGNSSGDHIVVYNGLEAPTLSFELEADVKLVSGDDLNALSAALVFGMENKDTPKWKWYGANIDTSRKDSPSMFRLFGPGVETGTGGQQGDIDIEAPLHLKLNVGRNGNFIYSFGNVGDEELRTISGRIPNWEGGYVGLLSFRSEAEFSNISFKNRISADTSVAGEATTVEGEAFQTNLEGMNAYGGTWEVNENGLYSNTVDSGNSFLYSGTIGSDFVYSSDISFLGDTGTAALLFRNSSETDHVNSYALSLDIGSGVAHFLRWEDGRTYQLVDDRVIEATADKTYNLKVVAVGDWMACYINGTLIANTGDYVIQPGNRGQNTIPENGYFGLQSSNGEIVFQNTRYTEIDSKNTPLLQDVNVTSSVGTVEKKAQFTTTQPIFIQYVKNDAETVDLNITPVSSSAVVTVTDAAGNIYADGKNIPVAEGINYIAITSTTTADDGTEAALTYRVNVFRRQADEVYYQETYRDQYHYSVKDGWANDPNGLVYYNGTYHLFYQFCTYTRQQSMHWAHATSKDLLTWEEEPVAFYPDANGAEFSGCMVVDANNTSGLFSTNKGGLVAMITADGNGQRLKIAYSEDEGATWTKLDQVILDWSQDPLRETDFRDPKIFRWENKWFMVIAGGPLRIYSSDNLLDWNVESTYATLHTECPDMYPIQTEDGSIKWVLSRGGRLYKVGDFEPVDGKWTFIPDAAYANTDGIMNFGRDSYAAMTYYVQDFGTAENPTLPEIVELNWMNTWDYCNEVADHQRLRQKFNGTFNLNLKLGLALENGTYYLTQTPIEAYKTLRADAVVDLKNVEVTADNTLLDDFMGDCYEIVATFTPGADTKKVGFKLRIGDNQETLVVYDVASETLTIDRSDSGVKINDRFPEGGSQKVTLNEDGTIDLHIFMDRASVEVFAKNYTAAGADQIFPRATSQAASVLVEGGAAKADITIYPMNSIWK